MMLIFELRAKITAVYQRYAFWLNLAARIILCFIAFSRIRSALDYNPTLGKSSVIIAISVISAVLPSTLMVFIAAVYVTLQIYAASENSLILAITVFALFMICYCFFIRFTPKFGAAVVATPVLQTFGFPYAMPLLMGVFGNPISIVPVCCGIFGYNMVHYAKENITTLSKMADVKTGDLVDPQGLYMKVLKQIVVNPAMYVTMLIMALVITVVYFIRRIRMDYAFEISIAVGTGLMMLGYIIGDLKYDMGIKVGSMVISCLICAGVVLFMLFFYRTLQYSAAENVEFEDDDYYYYVKAIPKIKVGAPKHKEKKVIRRRRKGDDEDEEEYEDAALGLIEYDDKTPGGGPTIKKKRTAAEIEAEEADDEFGDDLSLGDYEKSARYGTRVGEDNADDAGKEKKRPAPKRILDEFDDLDDDLDDIDELVGAGASKAADATKAGTAAASKVSAAVGDFDDDDDDDDDDEEVIQGYFPVGGDKPKSTTAPVSAKPEAADGDEDEDYL